MTKPWDTKRARVKRFTGTVLCLLVLFPVWPFFIVSAIGKALVAAMDWCVEGRALFQALLNLTYRIERRFGMDGGPEYQEWRQRQRYQCNHEGEPTNDWPG